MREDLLCEVRGRIIDRSGAPLVGRPVEFLPSRPYFVRDGVTLCPIGAKALTDEKGQFKVLLTRTDVSGVPYMTRGALGNYVIEMNGPGPHVVSKLLKSGFKMALMSHDS